MKIMIDAGHNNSGYDTGAEGYGLREQDVTYDIARQLGEILTKSGVTVNYTRPEKGGIARVTSLNDSLKRRCALSNEWGAEVFVSIHCNANANGSANGTEVYSYPGSGAGSRLAKAVQQRLCAALPVRDRGAKEKDFAVLRGTKATAILVETAFITNASDAALLRERKADFARAIAGGVCAYLGLPEPTAGAQPAGPSYDETVNHMLADGVTSRGNMVNWELKLSGQADISPAEARAIFDRYHAKLAGK